MKYLLVFYLAGFFLADAVSIKKYKLGLILEENEFQGTVTLTLSNTDNNDNVELDPDSPGATKCTYKGIAAKNEERPEPPKITEQNCTVEGNKIMFNTTRTGEDVVLEFNGTYQEDGLSKHPTNPSERFYVADMTAKNHKLIFPCNTKEKAQFEFEGDGVVMSNLEDLRKEDEKGEVFLRNLTFVQGDIVKGNQTIPSLSYYRMKSSEEMGQKLKNVMEKVAELDLNLQILFTPITKDIRINSRNIIILRNVDLKLNDSQSDFSSVSRELLGKLFQRPEGEQNTFFDIVGPEFVAMKILGEPDFTSEGLLKFAQIQILEKDGFNDSKSLNELASKEKRNPVVIVKGISVMYSLESICGNGNFTKGISNYLRKGNSDVSEAFLECFENKNKTDEFFKVWTDNPGYPVIHVILNKTAQYDMNQERFLWFGSEQKDQRWVIPTDYKTKEDPGKNIILPATKDNFTVTINSTYFILDHNNKGYYRVNYDAKLWEALISQLKSNHTTIDPVNRMKLIDDVFSFPKSTYNFAHGIPDYVTALKLSEYLRNETDIRALKVAFDALGFLESALNSSYHGKFRDHMKGILNGVYNKITKSEYSTLQNEIILSACKFGVEDCIKNATAMFRNITFADNKLSNRQKLAICSVVRNDSKKWMDSFTLLTVKDITSDEKNYLLGCSRNEEILSLFLTQFIAAKDEVGFKKAVTYTMQHNPDNIKVVLGIIKRFEGAIGKVFDKTGFEDIVRLFLPKLNSESAVTLREIAKNLGEPLKKEVEEVCERVKQWTDTKALTVGRYFKGRGSGSQARPIALVLLVTTLLPLANHIFHS